jgi:putative copper resistance protein D
VVVRKGQAGARPVGGLGVLPAAAGAMAVLALISGLVVGGAVDDTVLPGIPSAGAVTEWALPALTMLARLLSVLTVGGAVTAAFLLPGDGPSVSAHGWLLLRRTTWLAVAWMVSSAVLIVLSVSDLLGVPSSRLSTQAVAGFAFSIAPGQSLVLQAGLAGAVAVLTRLGVSRGTAAAAAVVAMLAVLPPAFTGHSAGAGNHRTAVTGLALHILAAALWAGGLAGLLMVRRSPHFAGSVARYSRLALVCFAATAATGIAGAGIRLGGWEALWTTRYGVLVLGKVLALVLVGLLGVAHRRRGLPALAAGRPGAFLRLAAGEAVVFGAAIGLAVALSRSPTPVPSDPVTADPLVELLGFDPPGAPTALRMLTGTLPDLFFLTVVALGTGAYLAGVARTRRAGRAWPVSRTVSWLAGMLLLAAITGLGPARYAYVLFTAHIVQHMVLSTAVPILLVGGAPITLALRTLRRPADPQVRGPREWLLIVLHSRIIRSLTHPLVALGIYLTGLFGGTSAICWAR